jgi:hypothetical protein
VVLLIERGKGSLVRLSVLVVLIERGGTAVCCKVPQTVPPVYLVPNTCISNPIRKTED